jgi:hypothetical protein
MKLYQKITIIIAATISSAASAQYKESTEGCLYKTEEIKSALGLDVKPLNGTVTTAVPVTMTSCNYTGKGRNGVILKQMKTDAPSGILRKDVDVMLAGKNEPVAGDADGARWQVAQGDLTDVSLDYIRKGVHTQIRVTGVDQKDKAAVEKMRSKLLKLRRLP